MKERPEDPEYLYVDMAVLAEHIQEMLKEKLETDFVEVKDDSERHRDHAGPKRTAGGHFDALIIARMFEKKSLLERHRMVYAALTSLLSSGIHAFSMRTLTPDEWKKAEKKAKK